MDGSSVRDHVREHWEIVVRGDLDALLADFSEELRPQVPQIGGRPVIVHVEPAA
jgi:hypothetical protein